MKIMQELKSRTKESHDRIEALAYSHKIMGGTITLTEYQELILKNYWFHAIAENALDKALSPEAKVELDFENRRKLSYLWQDLEELGLKELAQYPRLPKFELEGATAALGAMYVMEGATLGGAIIRRELNKNKSICQASSMNYYTCYGTNIGPYWKQFMGYMADNITTEGDCEAAASQAISTFELFEQILKWPVREMHPKAVTRNEASSARHSSSQKSFA